MKKFISVLLCLAIVFAMTATFASANQDTKLRFNNDGKFKIMQVADMQDDEILAGLVKSFLKKAIEEEKPDLIVLTGDNTAGYACKVGIKAIDDALSKQAVKQFMSIFEDAGVPVAMVYGNHDDDDTKTTKEDLMAMYQKYDCFIGYDAEPELYGCGTYNVPIYSSDGSDTMKFNLWMFDSNTYDEEKGGYDYVHPDQIAWYEKTEAALTEANGGTPVPSMLFQHIIVDEIWDCLEECNPGDEGAWTFDHGTYRIKPELQKGGNFKEWPCPGTQESLQFESVKENGNCLAMFFGHDHNNSFEIEYQGIDIVATPGFTCQSYSNEDRGFRIIELDENDLSTYDTHTIHWQDYYADSKLAMYQYNMNAGELGGWENFKNGFMYVLLFPIKLLFGYIF